MGEMRNVTKNYLEGLVVEGKILEWILNRVNMWTGFIWLGIGPVVVPLEHGNQL
jgi:hypothetical protein